MIVLTQDQREKVKVRVLRPLSMTSSVGGAQIAFGVRDVDTCYETLEKAIDECTDRFQEVMNNIIESSVQLRTSDVFIVRKWNYETKRYEPYESPANVLAVYSDDMDERTDCANCGKQMTYGDGYTSKTIHTDSGFGFPVCETCYEQEIQDEGIVS